jgi:flagellar biosynthetic protein FliO
MHRLATIVVTLIASGACLAAEAAPELVTAPNQPVAVAAAPLAALESTVSAAPAVESTRSAVPAIESTASARRIYHTAALSKDDPNNRPLNFSLAMSTDTRVSEAASGYTDTLKLIASLGAVIALIAFAVWGFRRFAPRTASMFASENLRVVSRTYLGPKQAVYLVKAPGRLLVVASAQDSITLLSEITDPDEIERTIGAAHAGHPKSQTKSFTNVLSGLSTGARDKDADTEAELAAAVKSVSERFASLNRRLESFEGKAD